VVDNSMCSNLAPELNINRPRKRPGLFAGVALCTALLGFAQARAENLTVCVDKANPMFATDMAVARAAASQAGLTPMFLMHNSAVDAVDDDDLTGKSQQKFFATLAAKCGVIMGFPVEAGYENLPNGMAASPPYVQTGFVVASQGAVPAASRVTHTGQVGVLLLTPAMTYFDDTTMAHEQVYYSNDDMYGALLHGQINAAFIWQPWLNQQLTAHPQKLHQALLDMPHATWDIVALHAQSAQADAAVLKFDSAVTALAASGRLRAIVQPFAVPRTED